MSPLPTPAQAFITSHLPAQGAPPRVSSEGPTPGLTFCHSDSREASDEQAATNQQLPTWPWCRSWELMPSTKRRGFSQMSCGEDKSGPHCQRGDWPASPCRPGAPVWLVSFSESSSPQVAQKALLRSPG